MSAAAAEPQPTPWPRSLAFAVLLSALACVIVLAFSWPSVTLDPRNVPVAISGPAPLVASVEGVLEEQSDGALALSEVPDRAAAVEAIATREAYGAIILGDAPEVLTSSAASAATHQLMLQLHAQLSALLQQQLAAQAAATGEPAVPTVAVVLTDVVPLSDRDPRGAGLSAAALPLVFGGMIGGFGVALLVAGAVRRIVALLAYAIIGGLAITGIMQGWYGVLGGSFLVNVSAFALTLLAMRATMVGFAAIFGRPGIAIGPLLFMLLGNPISGAAFPKEFYPEPWGALGQLLPPGAGTTLVRNASYFPEADSRLPITVLACWAVGGLILTALGALRARRRLIRPPQGASAGG